MYTKNYKPEYDRYIIAAPVTITVKGETDNYLVGAVVGSTANRQKLYLYASEIIKEVGSLQDRRPNGTSDQEPTSIHSILRNIIKGKLFPKKSDGDFKIPVFVLNSNWLFLCQYFFENCSLGLPAEEKPSLELVVRVVNINAGRNKKLLASCRKLYEYSRFVEIVREYTSSEENLTEIIAVAIDEAIREDVLSTR